MNKWNKEFFEQYKFEGLTFDDVLLIPGYSEVVPRDVNLKTRLSTNVRLNVPLVSADMDTVTEHELARVLAQEGGIGFIWKHPYAEAQADEVSKVKYTFNARIDTPICIGEDKTLEDVLKTLDKYDNRFSSLIVTNSDGKVVGLVTDNRTQFASNLDKVKDFMVKDPVTSEEEYNVHQAYDFMKERKIGKLILVNPDGTVKGLYCWNDVKEIVEKINPNYNRDKRGQLIVGANVGVRDFERAELLLRKHCDLLLVGTAHGHSKNVIETVRELKSQFKSYEFDVVAGNIATYEGAKDLFEAGADAVKVGVGPGSICTTRIIAGVGVPQITAVYEAARAAAEYDKPIIADGGIKYSGDITKAIAMGAESVMMGSIFAATEEAPGDEITVHGRRYKQYRGMGSLGALASSESSKERYGQKGAEKLVPEGVEGRVPLKGKVSEIIYQLIGGLRSGMGYVGAESIKDLQEKGRLLRISNAGQKESHPHDVEITKEAPNYGAK